MSEDVPLPPGISPQLRERLERLSSGARAEVLARFDHERRRLRSPLALVTLVAAPARAAGMPLVIMPSMYGTMADWRTFFDGIATDRAVYGVEMTGTATFAPSETSLQEIALACVTLIRTHLGDARVHLVGYSFGGRLAYDVGQQLRQGGVPPQSVLIVDATAETPTGRLYLRDLVSIAGNGPRWLRHQVRTYGAAALWRRAVERFRSADQPSGAQAAGFDPAAYARIRRRFTLPHVPDVYHPRLMQNEEAFRRYRPRPTANRVAYFASRIKALSHRRDVDGGWGALVAPDRFSTFPLPGDHLSAFQLRDHEPLRSLLLGALARAERPTPDRR